LPVEPRVQLSGVSGHIKEEALTYPLGETVALDVELLVAFLGARARHLALLLLALLLILCRRWVLLAAILALRHCVVVLA
jgi:hypothetical protein